MKTGVAYEDIRAEAFKNPELKKEYHKLAEKKERGSVPVYFVKEARMKVGMTQKDISDMTGMTQQSISDIEQGKGNPTVGTLRKIAHAMGGKLVIQIVIE